MCSVPGPWCCHQLPSSDSSHAAGSSALAVSTTSAALTSHPAGRCCHLPRRLWGSRRFVCAASRPRRHLDMPTPSGAFPSHPASLPSPQHQQAGSMFTGRASPLVVGSNPPPLYSPPQYCYLDVLQRVVCVPRPQGIAPSTSPLRPPPERRSARCSPGLFICMVGKVVRLTAPSPRRVRHLPSERCLPSSCAPDLSVSRCSHPPAQRRCSHTVSRPPPRMRSAASPPPPPRRLRGACGSRVGLEGSSALAGSLEGVVLSSECLAALSSAVLPREAHAGVQRSGFVLFSFSAVPRCASPRGCSACARRPGTTRAVCLECPPLTARLRTACGVRRPRCSGERLGCLAAPGVSPLAAHPCTTDWPIQMGL